MILQELIRNVVLYKGVVKPYLYSWRQSFFALSTKSDSSSLYLGTLLSRIKAKKHSGALTLIEQKRTNTRMQSYVSNDACITLRGGRIYEKVVGTTKTYSQSFFYAWKKPVAAPSETTITAIGFLIERTHFLITEAHERREYLGEFSLTRDETQLLHLKGGGEYV